MKKGRCDISVVVPIYEQWHLVSQLFDALEQQDISKHRWECLLVDNGSQEVPPASELPAFVTLLHCEKPGSYAARNVAIAHAKGELLVFTDSDCVPGRDWLSLLWSAYERQSRQSLLAGGVRVTKFEDGPHNIVELYDSAMGLPQARYVKRGYAVTANLSIPAEVMDKLEGFDDSRFSGGDADFCRRAATQGIALAFIPEASVRHPARSSFREIATKLKRVKGGQIRAGSLRRRVKFFIRTFVPPVWAYWYIVSSDTLTSIDKLKVLAFQNRLWLVEMSEVMLLVLGKPPERR